MSRITQHLLQAAGIGKQEIPASTCSFAVLDSHPQESRDLCTTADEGLTNLTWLSDLRAKDLTVFPVGPSPETLDSDDEEVDNYSILEFTLNRDQRKRLSPSLKRCLVELVEFQFSSIDYRREMVRPSFSYATIILLTLLNHPDQSLNLGDIYHWIKTNFLYYSQEDESWQTSIRQNLSLNPLFVKPPTEMVDPRLGHCWVINPEYHTVIHSHLARLSQIGDIRLWKAKHKGSRGKRRHSTSSIGKTKKNVSKKKTNRSSSHSSLTTDPLGVAELDWNSLLGSSRVQMSTGSPLFTPDIHPMSTPELASNHFTSPLLSAAIDPNLVEPNPFREFDLLNTPRPENESPLNIIYEQGLTADSKSILDRPHPWSESKEETLFHLNALNVHQSKWKDPFNGDSQPVH